MFSCHPVRLLQVEFWHSIGWRYIHHKRSCYLRCNLVLTSVYLNCCSTSLIVALHPSQTKLPLTNSGRTSDVRVTVPLILMSWPIRSILRSRMPEVRGRL
jgi:hypothetical protein